ncbi:MULTISPECIES: hypothetical protein [unclassified Amycolatopsis]|uniref:hypothetical protein n=1 Tax=unclassified Amycolatopsis TaxID=2618356 RepID=UPI00287BA39C|nr:MULTISPECIES: hypothetical protein [unclassified Amycolatopsis]
MFTQVKRFARSCSAVAMAAVLVLSGMPAAQATVPRVSGFLPPIGAELPMGWLSVNTPLEIGIRRFSVDFRGGIKVRVEANPADPGSSVRLRVIGLKVVGVLPAGDGSRQDGGTITLEQDDVDADAPSVLRLIQRNPPRYEQILRLTFTMTIDQPDSRREPLVLVTKAPAELVGELTQFPPAGDLHQLRNPVDLVQPDDPDSTIATIREFPVLLDGR